MELMTMQTSATEPPQLSVDQSNDKPTCQDVAIQELDGDVSKGLENSCNNTSDHIDFKFDPLGHLDICDNNPDFAVICSFILQFGEKLDLQLDIEDLRYSLEDREYVDENLIDLHVKLLKKVRRYFVRDQWEKVLIRYILQYSYDHAFELESLGYQKTRPSIKIELLRRLLEAQFECDAKFKALVNPIEANDLRLAPTGKDVNGNAYWHQADKQGNLRIYREEPLDFRSWKTVCKNLDELDALIQDLDRTKDDKVKGEPMTEPYHPLPDIFPEYFKIKSESDNIKEETLDLPEKSTKANSRGGRSKKGSNRNRRSNQIGKLTNIPTIKEENEDGADENSNHEFVNSFNLSSIKSESGIKKELDDFGKSFNTSEPPSSPLDNSIESQVKFTLEGIVSKVVSSINYFIRPKSRNSHEDREEEKDHIPETPKVSKKKPRVKKEKPVEEVLPRRSSSRIQQLQLKKMAEEEEKLKKMIESDSSKKTNGSSLLSQDDDSKSARKRSSSPESMNEGGGKKKRKKTGQTWKRGKGKKKLSWDKDDSDLSSVSSLTESNHDDDDLDDHDEDFKFDSNNFEDEFACEEEDTNVEPVIVKRARTARQSLGATDEQNDMNTSSVIEEDKPCGRCDKSNDPEWILLCDLCDDGYHTSCCRPPLFIVPDGDWFCPLCEHKTLLQKLRDLYAEVKVLVEAREREKMKRQRLRQTNNAKKPAIEAPPKNFELHGKRRRDILNELSDPIAIQALDNEFVDESDQSDDHAARGVSRKKTNKIPRPKKNSRRSYEDDEDDFLHRERKRPRKTYSRRALESDEEEDEEAPSEESYESCQSFKPKTRRARASVSYKFEEYDELIQSAIIEDSYNDQQPVGYEDDDDDNDNENEEEEEEEFSTPGRYGRGKDMATIEALAYQQENGLSAPSLPEVPRQEETTVKPKPKKKQRRLNDLDIGSETENATSDESFQASSATEAEDEDDDLTEIESSEETDSSIDELIASSRKKQKKFAKGKGKKGKRRRSSYDSDGSDYQPSRRGRRAAAMKVSYKESSEDDEDEDAGVAKKPVKPTKKNVLSSDEETQASWKSSGKPSGNEEDGADDEEEEEEEEGEDDQMIAEEYGVASASLKNETRDDKDGAASEKSDDRLYLDDIDAVGSQIDALEADGPHGIAPMNHPTATPPHRAEHPHFHSPIIHRTLQATGVQAMAPVSMDRSMKPAIAPPTIMKSLPASMPSSVVTSAPVERPRDPIQELIQYCSDSANSSASALSSYNSTLSSRPVAADSSGCITAVRHPPFYEEDRLQPGSSNDKN